MIHRGVFSFALQPRRASRLVQMMATITITFVIVACGDDGPTTIDSDSSVGFVPCGGEQCSSDEHCQRPIGFCGAAGNCEPRPKTCIEELSPVCGCNGSSYVNTCVAARNNVSVDKGGLCNDDDEPIDD